MPVKEFSPSDVLRLTQDALRAVGLQESLAVLKHDNLVGDDDHRCEGHVQIDGWLDIFPQLVGDAVGWGVSYTACVQGCRTMPNGDPGYPDDYDVVDVLLPSFVTHGINRDHTHARHPGAAVDSAILCWVRQRLKDFAESAVWDALAEEVTSEG
jgi:hypothetical protein